MMQQGQNLVSRAVAFVVALAMTSLVGTSLLSNDSSTDAWLTAVLLGAIAMFPLARLLTPMFTRRFIAMAICRDFRAAVLWTAWSAFPRGMRTLSS
jgi:hypothetical protein